jgi:hypothetical protein
MLDCSEPLAFCMAKMQTLKMSGKYGDLIALWLHGICGDTLTVYNNRLSAGGLLFPCWSFLFPFVTP